MSGEPNEELTPSEEERRDALAVKERESLNHILDERDYQRGRWNSSHDVKHSAQDWASIITVYTGKVSATTYPYDYTDKFELMESFRKRVTQLAAVCLAALEATAPEDE